MPTISKFGENLTKFWQKQVGSFLAHHVESQMTRPASLNGTPGHITGNKDNSPGLEVENNLQVWEHCHTSWVCQVQI